MSEALDGQPPDLLQWQKKYEVLPRSSYGAFQFSSVQFSLSAMSDSLLYHGLQDARLSCPSLYPGVCSNSYPSSQ